jgi:integrase
LHAPASGASAQLAETETALRGFAAFLRHRDLSERTIVNYVGFIRRGLLVGDLLGPVRDARTPSARTVAIAALAQYGEYIGDSRPAETARRLRGPRAQPRPRIALPMPAWRGILAEAGRLPEPARSLVMLVGRSGLRYVDVSQITREQAAVAARGEPVQIVQKGGRLRIWSPSPAVQRALGNLLRRNGWRTVQELLAPRGRYDTSYRAMRRLISVCCKRAGVRAVGCHEFRHRVATRLHEKGWGLPEIQAVLGHRSWKTTLGYVGVSPERQARAITDVDGDLGDDR